MKIQKQKTRKSEEYYKYVITLSKDILKKAGFEEGDELKAEAKNGEIKLKKAKRTV